MRWAASHYSMFALNELWDRQGWRFWRSQLQSSISHPACRLYMLPQGYLQDRRKRTSHMIPSTIILWVEKVALNWLDNTYKFSIVVPNKILTLDIIIITKSMIWACRKYKWVLNISALKQYTHTNLFWRCCHWKYSQI